MKHECGILVLSLEQNIDKNSFIENLKKLEHRGRESFGIGYIKDGKLINQRYNYQVSNYKEKETHSLQKNAIGHVRYSTTTNKTNTDNIQPLKGHHGVLGEFLLVHNGNIPFIEFDDGKSDTYHLLDYIQNSKCLNYCTILEMMIKEIKGVYCIALLDNKGSIYICRDSYGVRPYVIGYKNNNICVASESICFPEEFTYSREVVNGEILKIKDGRILHVSCHDYQKQFCSFEYIYFFRKDSMIGSRKIEEIRYQFGVALASEEVNIVEDAIVVGAPNSGIISGKGFAKTLNLPYHQVMWKDNTCGRSFILPDQQSRINLLGKYMYYDKEKLKGCKLYLVDDSIVRGTTMKKFIETLRDIGVAEIHIRVASPPVRNPCYFGIDIPTSKNLVAGVKNVEEIRQELKCDSLKYLDIGIIKKVIGDPNMCTACFTGEYPKIYDW